MQEHTNAVKGKFTEELGYYMPAIAEKTFNVDLDRVKYWLSVGAQPSDSVAALLKKAGMDGMDKFIAPRDKKRKPKKEQPEEAAPAPAAAPAAEAPAEEAATPEEAPAEEEKSE